MEIFNGNVRIGQVFPQGIETSHDVLADSYELLTPTYAATLAVQTAAKRTFLAPTVLAGALTVNVTPGVDFQGGEQLTVKILSDASARVVTLGTGITGPALTTVASKTHVANFVHDGNAYIQTGPWVQID